MIASDLEIQAPFYDTECCSPGYSRAHNIHDQFRSLQDVRCSRSEVLEGYIPSLTIADLSDSRCIGGLLNGNVGVAKSMMGELTDSTNIDRVSGLFPLVRALGATIG